MFTATPLLAVRPLNGGTTTGAITGNVKDAQGRNLTSYTVRLRNVATGELGGSNTPSVTGLFSFNGVPPGNYIVEIVNQAGEIIGTSAAVSVDAGATVAVTVAAMPQEATDGRRGGFFSSSAALIAIAAAGAGVVGVAVAQNKDDASPSR
jgi:hypothetical protein